jgi:hypothetical protein
MVNDYYDDDGRRHQHHHHQHPHYHNHYQIVTLYKYNHRVDNTAHKKHISYMFFHFHLLE